MRTLFVAVQVVIGLALAAERPQVTVNPLAGPYVPAYPVKVSASGRYLVDQNNVPFMMVGDAPQALIGNLSESLADAYFADREAHGFNTLWINLLCTTYTGCNKAGTTYDGLSPFTRGNSPRNYDLSKPNETYFKRVDDMLHLAANHHLQVFLDPIETGGWLITLQSNGATKAYQFGQYLGNRYKNFQNIVWMSGNDFQTWKTTSDDAVVLAVAQGIRSFDSNHIQTTELNYELSSSLDDNRWAPLLGLNSAYTYYPTYDEVLHAYNQASSIPTFLVEAHYESETVGGCCEESGTPKILRLQEYWSMLSGATGQLYGNHYTWTITNSWLYANIDTLGVTQLGYWKAFFASRPWYNLIPDQTHIVVTAGYGNYNGTGALGTNTYVTTARTPDGALVVLYAPVSTTLQVDMTKLAGTTTANWFDPANGTYTPVAGSPFANTGTRSFTTPGNNSAGDTDWVLVLESPII